VLSINRSKWASLLALSSVAFCFLLAAAAATGGAGGFTIEAEDVGALVDGAAAVNSSFSIMTGDTIFGGIFY
jgi:hypothetical protein